MVELGDVFYVKEEFIETQSGNKISRKSALCGSQNIVLQGKSIVHPECMIRGDLAAVRIGRHCILGRSTVIRPPFKKFSNGVAFFPLQIGDHVIIDEGSIVEAGQVGSYVHIGKGCVIGRKTIIKDCAAVLDGSVVAPETVIPPFAVFGGSPAKCIGELPECTQDLLVDATVSYYQHFLPVAASAR